MVRVQELVGYQSTEVYGFPDGRLMRHEREIADRLAATIEAFKPDLIFCPFPADAHRDHQASAIAVTDAASRARWNGSIWAYEVWTALWPNAAIDITAVAEAKEQAVCAYVSQPGALGAAPPIRRRRGGGRVSRPTRGRLALPRQQGNVGALGAAPPIRRRRGGGRVSRPTRGRLALPRQQASARIATPATPAFARAARAASRPRAKSARRRDDADAISAASPGAATKAAAAAAPTNPTCTGTPANRSARKAVSITGFSSTARR
jgi:hypothetical protein